MALLQGRTLLTRKTCQQIVQCLSRTRNISYDTPDIAQIRHPYHDSDNVFDVEHLSSRHPYKQFTTWFDEARNVPGLLEPNAMSLATATKDGIPSMRMVLMKGYSEEGIKFFSNYESRKGKELAENPRCALMFYWEPQKRVIRIEGSVERISEEDSTAYFDSRPKDSRLGAMVSHQSTVLPNRDVLNSQFEALCDKYNTDEPIPKPNYWGGYLVRPHSYEFWQGQSNRLHDRLRFRKLTDGEQLDPETMEKGEEGWVIERLSP